MVNHGEEMLYFIYVEQSIIRIPSSNNSVGNLVDQELRFSKHRLKNADRFIWILCTELAID